MLENGTWVVKNVEGKITATWNAETQSWTYSPENIKVSYTQIGNEVYQSVLEPYMGSLPPDDPATHFKDENGNPVDYGIGPETRIEVMGGGTIPLTEVFARYRGFVPLASFYPHLPGASALILEIPRTPDTSIIVVIYGGTKYFYILATPDDSAIYDRYNIIHPHEWVTADTAIPIANEHLIGQMVMILVQTDSATGEYAYLNQNAKTFLDFIAGTSTHIPLFGLNEGFNIHSGIIAPVSSMPQP
jgi:hypothetical protein